MILLQVIHADTDLTGQLLIIYCAFFKYLRKIRMGFQIKAYDSAQWRFSTIFCLGFVYIQNYFT